MIAIDVISGFLGAGKTTFCNLLLDYYLRHGERTAYVVNEFGDTGLDANIIKNEGFNGIELTNGCVCCTLQDDIVFALREMILSMQPDRIVFEPSGIFMFDNFFDIFQDAFIKTHCQLGNVITIIDAVNYHMHPPTADSFIENQIHHSKSLVLSKLERFDGDVSEILCDLKRINPEAAIFARPWDEYSEQDITELLAASQGEISISTKKHKHQKLASITIPVQKDFTPSQIETFRKELASGAYGELLRVKGYITIDGVSHLLNAAMADFQLEPLTMHEQYKLTFIGEHLNKGLIKKLCKK